jgi:hypothetical protein
LFLSIHGENLMRTKSQDPEKVAASAARKEQDARAAALAMQDYRAHAAAVLANTERLRALRLKKEANAATNTKKPPKAKRS